MRNQKPHSRRSPQGSTGAYKQIVCRRQTPFVVTRINDNRTIWHLTAIIVAASMLLLFVTALNIAGAATNPPQLNVVPNFSGLKVAGDATINGLVKTHDLENTGEANLYEVNIINLFVKNAASFLKDLVVTGKTTMNGGAGVNGSLDVKGSSFLRGDVYIASPNGEVSIKGHPSFGITVDTPLYVKKSIFALDGLAVGSGKKLFASDISGGIDGINILDSINVDPAKILNVTFLRGGLVGAVQPLKIMSDLFTSKDFDIGGTIKNSVGGKVNIGEAVIGGDKAKIETSQNTSSVDIKGNISLVDGSGLDSLTVDNSRIILQSGPSAVQINNGGIITTGSIASSGNIATVGDISIGGTGKLKRGDLTDYITTMNTSVSKNVDPGGFAKISLGCNVDYEPVSCGIDASTTEIQVYSSYIFKNTTCAVGVKNLSAALQNVTAYARCLRK